MSVPRSGHTMTLLPNRMVLVTGGSNGSTSYLSSTSLYDPSTGQWLAANPMNTRRARHQATPLKNGRVLVSGGSYSYLVGGLPTSVTVNSVQIFDSATGLWSATDSLEYARSGHTATLLNDERVLVCGGSSVEIFDPNVNLWNTIAPTPTTVSRHKAILLNDGRVLIPGSYEGGPIVFDPVTNQWTNIASGGGHGASSYGVTLLKNGKVLICGGSDSINSYMTKTTIYNPTTNTWKTVGSMKTGRENPSVTLLSNGSVLAAGGTYRDATAEIFDPVAESWTTTGAMNVHRPYITTVELADGSIMAAGGRDLSAGSPTYFSSVEIYQYQSTVLTTLAEHGAVTGNSSPYFPKSTAVLTATPNPGYVFVGWSGDAAGAQNPLSLVMDYHKTIEAKFNPDPADPDDDGWSNFQEIVIHGTNPSVPDSDGDQVKDSLDAFPLDSAEWLDTDHDNIGDNADTDDDGDGLSDVEEIGIHHTNPKLADSDGDGLSDPAEIQTHLTNPNLADSDNDGLSDGAEVNTHGTMPKVADTDGDGFLDGYEVLTGKSPIDILEKPALVAEARTAIEFTFPAALGKTYRIEDSLDLETWGTVESGIVGNGSAIQRFYTTRNLPKRYFRAEEEAP